MLKKNYEKNCIETNKKCLLNKSGELSCCSQKHERENSYSGKPV